MNRLNNDLRQQAIELGLCDEWQGLWSIDWSEDKLAERMYTGLDFCLKHHWPSNEYLKEHFHFDFLRSKGIIVDDNWSLLNPKQSLILGESSVIARFNAWNHGEIYVRDKSRLKLTAKNGSFVIAHLLDESYIEAEQLDKAHVTIVTHSPNAIIIADKNIKVKEEYEYLHQDKS